MAKNDYYVIVYQILSYLYQRLKKGEQVKSSMLNYDSPLFDAINKKYWAYIIYQLSKMGFVEGIDFAELDGLNIPYPVNLDNCMITPLGIEYLCDNSMIQKAKRFLKDISEIVPFEVLK